MASSALADDEAEGKGTDFYANELNDRFAKGPVDFNLFAVLGQPGDQDDDPTSEWPADRKSVKMGTISITGLEPAESCDVGIFDPEQPRRRCRAIGERQDPADAFAGLRGVVRSPHSVSHCGAAAPQCAAVSASEPQISFRRASRPQPTR